MQHPFLVDNRDIWKFKDLLDAPSLARTVL
jgi:hypothetical protein